MIHWPETKKEKGSYLFGLLIGLAIGAEWGYIFTHL